MLLEEAGGLVLDDVDVLLAGDVRVLVGGHGALLQREDPDDQGESRDDDGDVRTRTLGKDTAQVADEDRGRDDHDQAEADVVVVAGGLEHVQRSLARVERGDEERHDDQDRQDRQRSERVAPTRELLDQQDDESEDGQEHDRPRQVVDHREPVGLDGDVEVPDGRLVARQPQGRLGVVASLEVERVTEDDLVPRQPQHDAAGAEEREEDEPVDGAPTVQLLALLGAVTLDEQDLVLDGGDQHDGDDQRCQDRPALVARQGGQDGADDGTQQVAVSPCVGPLLDAVHHAGDQGEQQRLGHRRGAHVEHVDVQSEDRGRDDAGELLAGEAVRDLVDQHDGDHVRDHGDDAAGEAVVVQRVVPDERDHQDVWQRKPYATQLRRARTGAVDGTPGDLQVRDRVVVRQDGVGPERDDAGDDGQERGSECHELPGAILGARQTPVPVGLCGGGHEDQPSWRIVRRSWKSCISDLATTLRLAPDCSPASRARCRTVTSDMRKPALWARISSSGEITAWSPHSCGAIFSSMSRENTLKPQSTSLAR